MYVGFQDTLVHVTLYIVYNIHGRKKEIKLRDCVISYFF
jgi:hypothetical protein